MDEISASQRARSIELRKYHVLLETIPRWGFVVVVFVFVALIFITGLIATFSGPVLMHQVENKYTITDAIMRGNESIVTSLWLEPKNQDFSVYVYFQRDEATRNLYGITREDTEIEVQLTGRFEHNINGSGTDVTTSSSVRAYRKLECLQSHQLCESVVVAHRSFIDYNNYETELRLLNFEELFENKVLSTNLTVQVLFVNGEYTTFEILYRYVFIVCTLATLVVFYVAVRAKHVVFSNLHTEQKWVLVMLITLIFFNNPLYPLNFYVPAWFFPLLDIVFVVTHIYTLLLALLVFIHSILTPPKDRSYLGFYAPKIALMAVLWLLSVVVLAWHRFQETDDPAVIYSDFPLFSAVVNVVFALLLVYLVAIVYFFIRIVALMRKLPRKYSARFRSVWAFTFVVVWFCVAAFIAVLANGLLYSAPIFVIFHSLMTFYPLTLAFFFFPSNKVDNHEIDVDNNIDASMDL